MRSFCQVKEFTLALPAIFSGIDSRYAYRGVFVRNALAFRRNPPSISGQLNLGYRLRPYLKPVNDAVTLSR